MNEQLRQAMADAAGVDVDSHNETIGMRLLAPFKLAQCLTLQVDKPYAKRGELVIVTDVHNATSFTVLGLSGASGTASAAELRK